MVSNRKRIIKKRRIQRITFSVICFLLLLSCVAFAFNYFSNYIKEQLYENASESIEETYSEVGQILDKTSQSRINYLTLLGNYFNDIELTNEEYNEVINRYKQLCGFTDFYFLNENGQYLTINNESGYIDLGLDLIKLKNNEVDSVIVDGSLPNREGMLFYIVSVVDNSYQEFPFTAIAFGYTSTDMSNSLKIDAYEGKSISYVVNTNGKIAASIEATVSVNNVFTILEHTSNLSSESIDTIKQDFSNRDTDTWTVNIDDYGEYYFSYQPLNFNNWMLVSLTPTYAANRGINNVRSITTYFIMVVFGALFLILGGILFVTFRSSIKNKDGLILQRNMVFDLACRNLNELYFLYNTITNTIDYVSPNILRLTGIESDDFYDDNSLLVIEHTNDNRIENIDQMATRFIASKQNYITEEVYVKSANSNHKTTYSMTLQRNENEQFGIIVLSDRSEELKIRQELRDALESANVANKAKTSFLSNVSHDMRTPMNAIVGFANLMAADPTNSEKVLEYTNKIQLSSNHLLGLINDVLDFSKIESGKTTLNIASVDIDKVVRSVDSLIRPQVLEKKQTLNVVKHYFKDCIVKADELRVSQILINILSNAIKYTPKGGIINFDVESNQYHQYIEYVFTISDNGMGMSEAFVKTIFEPFTRETSSKTNRVQGTGLGMAITKNLVDLMGGTIEVESKKDVGSTFIVKLYLVEDEESMAHNNNNNNNNGENVSIKGLNILAAEDNELNAEIIQALLENEGANITVVENGQIALDTFVNSKENAFDVILMDVQMPVMDGYSATEHIRISNHPQAKTIPIIAMTANAFIDDINDAINAGMNAHVSKPIDMNILKSTINQCLENYKKAD